MAIDIGIGTGSGSPMPVPDEPSVQLTEGAAYCFLHPLFGKLADEMGQYIDLYGDASFAGEGLAALKRTLAEARRLAEAQPDTWQVHIGIQISPVRRELYERLDRAVLLDLLTAWDRVVARAEESGRPVVCFGD